MEEALVAWQANHQGFPWPWRPTIRDIEDYVDGRRLRPKGLIPPPNLFDSSGQDQRIASRRAEAAINTWGPHLFPLIERAEVKLKGIRTLNVPGIRPRADYYEVKGVVDVLSKVTLSQAQPTNEIALALEEALGRLDNFGPEFEVIVDYKGMRRPAINSPEWARYEWQLRTYAFLRSMQRDARPIAAGIVLFLNELSPSGVDIESLQENLQRGVTDIIPGSADLAAINSWRPRSPVPSLNRDFLKQRSIHVVSMTESLITQGLTQFDSVVAQIETAVAQEMGGTSIPTAWATTFLNAGNHRPDAAVCTACDFQARCPILRRYRNPEAP